MAETYNENLNYVVHPLKQRHWGWERQITFYRSDGKIFEQLMQFQTEPTQPEIDTAIALHAARVDYQDEEEIIAEDGEQI